MGQAATWERLVREFLHLMIAADPVDLAFDLETIGFEQSEIAVPAREDVVRTRSGRQRPDRRWSRPSAPRSRPAAQDRSSLRHAPASCRRLREYWMPRALAGSPGPRGRRSWRCRRRRSKPPAVEGRKKRKARARRSRERWRCRRWTTVALIVASCRLGGLAVVRTWRGIGHKCRKDGREQDGGICALMQVIKLRANGCGRPLTNAAEAAGSRSPPVPQIEASSPTFPIDAQRFCDDGPGWRLCAPACS